MGMIWMMTKICKLMRRITRKKMRMIKKENMRIEMIAEAVIKKKRILLDHSKSKNPVQIVNHSTLQNI